jgi:hypothetical protein
MSRGGAKDSLAADPGTQQVFESTGGDTVIWLLVLLLLILAIGGGVALSKFLFLLLVVALAVALFGAFGRTT